MTRLSDALILLIGDDRGEVSPALSSLRTSSVATLDECRPLLARSDLAVLVHPQPLAPLLAAAPILPVVVVQAPAGARARLLEAGATAALCAPLDPRLLLAELSSLLRLRRALDLKDQFLATLSHELRTPLTSILGWVRLLRLGKASADPAGRALEAIERNARTQAQLVDDLLDVQRIAAGTMSLSFREVELGALLDAAVDAARRAANEAGIGLQLARPADEELRVFGDGERLHQIFANLIGNAIKFSPRGAQVRVSLLPSGNEAVLIVADEGRGMEASFLPDAFEPFRQEESDLSREKGGLGLGLSIVRHLVETHGGSVTAESEGAGRGARFTVTLPLRSRVARPPASRPPPARPTPAPAERQGLEGVQILVVDDDLDTQYLVSTMLEQFGARVSTANSAPEAIHALEARRFDLLLSDVSMPGEDGYSLIRRVRAGAVQPAIPAAALTANARREDRNRALASGFQLHIAKPVEPAELAQSLTQLLAR